MFVASSTLITVVVCPSPANTVELLRCMPPSACSSTVISGVSAIVSSCAVVAPLPVMYSDIGKDVFRRPLTEYSTSKMPSCERSSSTTACSMPETSTESPT